MIKNLFFLILTFLLCNTLFARENDMTMADLKQAIQNELNAVEGKFAVAFKELYGAEEALMINEGENFHAASTMKTPVMIGIFDKVEKGSISLSDSIFLKNEFKSIVDGSFYSMDIGRDSGDSLYEKLNSNVPIRELVHQMITVSSNLATNTLIEFADAEEIMKIMRSIGANDIKVLRGVEDMKAFDKGLNNTTTAKDLMLVFEAIAKKKLLSEKSHEEMISILLDQEHKDIIPAKLPDGVKVANKTGSISGVRHDSGIVFLPDGCQYVLVLLSKELKDTAKGKEALASVSKMIYDYVISKG